MKIKDQFLLLLDNKNIITYLLITVTLMVTLQNILMGAKDFWGAQYTYYNNYVIFKYSFVHLIENKNLYILHLQEHADYFKYSPTFAFCMFFFAYLPDWFGLLLWNFLNVSVFYISIVSIEQFSSKKVHYVFFIILLELILSLQNSQSNALITGLIILTFNYFEKEKIFFATLFIAVGFYIKIFSIVSCLFLLFYQKKIKSILYLIFWIISLGLFPLFVITPEQLIDQYLNWKHLLISDHSNSLGLSIYQFIPFELFGIDKKGVLIFGIILLLTPLIYFKNYSNVNFRLSYLEFLLIWLIVFNHRAESPSFIIAITGCGLWWLNSNRGKFENIVIVLTILFTSIRFTDLIKNEYNILLLNWTYLKPMMSIFVFFVIFFNFFKMKNQSK